MESDYYRNVLYDQVYPMPVTIEPDLENPRPIVTAEIDAGKFVEDFDIDIDAVVARMKDEGISDETIANSEIVLRATTDNPSERMRTYGDYVKSKKRISMYADAHTAVDANRQFAEGYASGVESEGGDYDRSYEFVKSASDLVGSHQMAETLYHEIRHMKQDDSGQKNNVVRRMGMFCAKAYLYRYVAPVAAVNLAHHTIDTATSYDASLASVVGVAGLSAFAGIKSAKSYYDKNVHKEMYIKDPMEIDAREAEKEIPAGYSQLPVMIKARYS